MAEQKKKRNIVDSIELMLIKDMPSRFEKGAGAKIRVVQWVFDDGTFSVKLERRSYFTKDGKVMNGKADGFSLDDLAFLHPKWKEMIQLMKKPPLPPKKAPAPAKPDEGIIEEVPF